ncbi:formimidoylglutamase [Taibaiella soli]|uniref:Arginase n=1 Tax=Taibaiella soli TaxID=1649169 RepID=A0A2W2AFZ1_9BACT|nr:formimidoylglutamase [Taibaiella soli]PZF71150.1 arginase [Taibaiella soli]
MGKLVIATQEKIDDLISKRAGETKFGERIQLANVQNWEESIRDSNAKYVLVGIPEDIGVRANLGVGGAHTGWEAALKAILNVQNTNELNGENVLLLGWFDFANWLSAAERMDVAKLRVIVENIDELVYPVIQKIVAAGKIPIAIGGGHNNAYALLKGSSLALGQSVNAINLDAHSDYRVQEGRHSGNGFRYAKAEGYLEKYAMVGLHQNYNSEAVLGEIKQSPDLHYSFYEDIFLREQQTYTEALIEGFEFVKGKPAGIELDLDCIENVLSSAITPCGISTLQARQYIFRSKNYNPVYLHIPEGATLLRDGRSVSSTGKLIAYLVTDFIRL